MPILPIMCVREKPELAKNMADGLLTRNEI